MKSKVTNRKNLVRGVSLILVVLLIAPVFAAGINYSDDRSASSVSNIESTATNVTFVTTQGGFKSIDRNGGQLLVIETNTKQTIWTHDSYRRYMDVDPVGSDRVLVVAGAPRENGGFKRVAVTFNWRTGERVKQFSVPADTHDIDYVGNGGYAIADKANHRAYIYYPENDSITWEYSYQNHFAPNVSPEPVDGDWTHLNDIDSVRNDTHILLSPRNFDKVHLVNKSTKESVWILNRNDSGGVLRRQHNPVLLSSSPPTVLTADSNNDRVVEHELRNGSWRETWSYRSNLSWTRDADRLPNGNTIIVDTSNNRVLEVSPNKSIVWSIRPGDNPYDVERLKYGEEPSGPTMREIGSAGLESDNSGSPVEDSFGTFYRISAWVLPIWMTQNLFGRLLLTITLLLAWSVAEILAWRRPGIIR
jgi:hypothetical protein